MEHYKNLDLAPIEYFCEFDLVWKTEEWKDITDYESHYQVSDLGRIKSLNYNHTKKERILKIINTKASYSRINLFMSGISKTRTIHQLVGIVFLGHIPCGQELVINHKNFIKNDNRKVNLEIVTQRENGNKKHIKSISKHVGVSWHKKNNYWTSCIFVNKKLKHLGCFNIEKEASKYYENALIAIQNGTEIKVKKHIQSSKFKGVYFHKKRKKFMSRILIGKKYKFIGYYDDEIEANNAYENALKNLTNS